MVLLASAEQIENPRSRGGTYLDGVPFRFVIHTVEGVPKSLDGARAIAASHEFPPHLWYWPEHRWLGQTVPLDRSAFALLHTKGVPATNKMRALQVEVFGFAKDTPTWDDEIWDRIGQDVLAPILAAGFPINLERVAPTTGNDGFGIHGKVRMSREEWREFDGICCHANVPDNEHWDVGKGNLARVAAAAGGTNQEGFMALTNEEQLELLDRVRAMHIHNWVSDVTNQGDLGWLARIVREQLAPIAAQQAATMAAVQALATGQGVNGDELARVIREQSEAAVRAVLDT